MTVTDRQRYLFDTQGFVVIPGALSAAEVQALNAAIDAAGIENRRGPEGRDEISGFLHQAQEFRDLIDHPSVLAHLTEWLVPAPRLDHYYCIFSDPGTPVHELHLGGTPYIPATSYQVRNGRILSDLTVVSYALNDVPPASGFACVPGSHKAEFSCPADIIRLEDHTVVANPPMRAGDAVIFTEALTHGAFAWNAPYTRRALLYKYTPGHMAWSPTAYADEALPLLNDRQRKMLLPPYLYTRPSL